MVGEGREPCIRRFLADELRFALIHDLKAFLQPSQRRLLADNVMRESVQGSHAITEMRNETARLDHLADARREIIHCRVDEGHDEHILVGVQRSTGDELRGKRREGEGLS